MKYRIAKFVDGNGDYYYRVESRRWWLPIWTPTFEFMGDGYWLIEFRHDLCAEEWIEETQSKAKHKELAKVRTRIQ